MPLVLNFDVGCLFDQASIFNTCLRLAHAFGKNLVSGSLAGLEFSRACSAVTDWVEGKFAMYVTHRPGERIESCPAVASWAVTTSCGWLGNQGEKTSETCLAVAFFAQGV